MPRFGFRAASRFGTISAVDEQQVIYVLDLLGTSSFAFSGVLRGFDRRPDIIGMVILAAATALGGGIIRDMILGQPVAMLRDMNYLLVILGSAAVAFLFPTRLKRREAFFKYFDAFGLGVFSAIGASLAWKGGLNPVSVLFIAGLTGAGGGVIRDVLLGEMPLVLYKEIYILAVAVGAGALMAVEELGGGAGAGFLTAMIVTFVIRALAIRFNWSLPRFTLR